MRDEEKRFYPEYRPPPPVPRAEREHARRNLLRYIARLPKAATVQASEPSWPGTVEAFDDWLAKQPPQRQEAARKRLEEWRRLLSMVNGPRPRDPGEEG